MEYMRDAFGNRRRRVREIKKREKWRRVDGVSIREREIICLHWWDVDRGIIKRSKKRMKQKRKKNKYRKHQKR
jgi:hypothetical protein